MHYLEMTMSKSLLQHIKDTVADIKDDFSEGVNDSHSEAYASGASDALDALVNHFEEITNECTICKG